MSTYCEGLRHAHWATHYQRSLLLEPTSRYGALRCLGRRLRIAITILAMAAVLPIAHLGGTPVNAAMPLLTLRVKIWIGKARVDTPSLAAMAPPGGRPMPENDTTDVTEDLLSTLPAQ